jgi:ABC-type multidrug transport system permease subunit
MATFSSLEGGFWLISFLQEIRERAPKEHTINQSIQGIIIIIIINIINIIITIIITINIIIRSDEIKSDEMESHRATDCGWTMLTCAHRGSCP